MNALVSLTALLALVAATSAGPEVPAKVLKKIAHAQLMSSCWGEENMMNFYRQLKHVQEECYDLKPTFKIDLFDKHSDEAGHAHFHAPGNVFKSAYPPQQVPYQPAAPAAVDPAAYNAFMAYWAFQQQQQALQAPNKYAMYARGGNFQQVPRRYRRDHHEEEEHMLTSEDVADFQATFDMFKSDMVHNMGNLTCVLSKLQLLDERLRINMRTLWTTMWEEGGFGSVEPELKEKAIEGYNACNDISQAIPQEILDKKPITRQFGRQMIFFKCLKKMETSLCVKKELSRWMDAWHGPVDQSVQARLGLPEDKYEAAMVAFKVMDYAKSGTEKFIGKFFFGSD